VVVVVVVRPLLLRPPPKEEKPPEEVRSDADGAGVSGLRDGRASLRPALAEVVTTGFPVSGCCTRSLMATDEPDRTFTNR
jgi:hypothetical protein